MKRFASLITIFFFLNTLFMGVRSYPDDAATQWVDSVFNTLTDDQRITQLMIIRESTFSRTGPIYHDSLIRELINKYNIGGICLFQGTPVKQANLINEFQQMAQTPLMVCIDGEWGLGMRLDSVSPLKHQMMLGAAAGSSLAYEYGKIAGRQMKRMGIHVDYAPVVDINNNPANPVINDRSFGENKYKVASFGLAYARGLQEEGIMACAKHFPGHGDVSVDSHLDLPVINKTMEQLDTLELFPFKRLIEGGVASIMIGHLFIPAIDNTPHTASSISRNAVTGLLRDQLHFGGLTFTDALDMKGVAKYFPSGRISAQSLIAGNDMLCLPHDVEESIEAIRVAIRKKELSWNDIYEKCRKVLLYKYNYGMAHPQQVDTRNLTKDLNAEIDGMNQKIAENAITLLANQDKDVLPLENSEESKIAFLGIGLDSANTLAAEMESEFNSDNFYLSYNEDLRRISTLSNLLQKNYQIVIIGVHNYRRYPANRFGITDAALRLINNLAGKENTIVLDFGNPYAIQYLHDSRNLIACYEDDSITQSTAIRLLKGELPFKGVLPVSASSKFKVGNGIMTTVKPSGQREEEPQATAVFSSLMPEVSPAEVNMNATKLNAIDSIVNNGIRQKAFPGAVVLGAREGKIFYRKAFGTYNYGEGKKMTTETIFDLASVTKILATTLSVMKLYDEGKIKLDAALGTYLPRIRNSNKKNLLIRDILLHQAGLVAFIPFYKKLIDPATGEPLPQYLLKNKDGLYSIRVAQNLYLRKDYEDSIYQIILDSRLGRHGRYIYSDNDFIFLGKIVEQISGLTLDEYAMQNFYKPLGLHSTGFFPREKFDLNRVAPTENEKDFRMQHLLGDVHDPGAALFGGMAGHAGLFSDAGNMAVLLQMLLNGGTFNGQRYLKESTIKLFTSYNSTVSRRGYGFDKPEKDNYTTTKKHPYPSRYASSQTYGHTGYTGTCIWVDPKYDLVYIFLSNRVNPDGGDNVKISTMNIRGAIEDTFYRAIMPTPSEVQKREGE